MALIVLIQHFFKVLDLQILDGVKDNACRHQEHGRNGNDQTRNLKPRVQKNDTGRKENQEKPEEEKHRPIDLKENK